MARMVKENILSKLFFTQDKKRVYDLRLTADFVVPRQDGEPEMYHALRAVMELESRSNAEVIDLIRGADKHVID